MNLPVTAPHPAQAGVPALPMAPPPLVGLQVSAEQKLELLEAWRSITKRKWMVLGLALAVAVLAAVVAMAMTPIYQSTATVLIEAGKGKILSIEDVYGSGASQREHFQTQAEVLKSREVAERAVRKLKLWEHAAFDPRKAPPGYKQQALELFGLAQPQEEWTEPRLVDQAVRGLMAGLKIEPVRLSQLIKVSFESADPDLAARVANTVAAQYIESDRDARFEISQTVSSFLQQRLADLRDKLAQSEQALQDYREKKGIVNLQGASTTMAGQQAGATNQQVLDARARRLALESSYQQARSITDGDYSSVPAVQRDGAAAQARSAYLDAQRKLSAATETLGAAHPTVVQLRTDLEQTQRNMLAAQRTAIAALNNEYTAARSTELALSQALGSARGAVQDLNREEFQLAALERDAATNRQLYEMFMNRAKETNLAGDVQTPIARVVDAAVAPQTPIKPRRSQIVLVATLLALLLGAAASVLIDRLDNTIKGAEDAEIRLKQPVLAAIPAVLGSERPQMARLYLDDAHSHFAEAVRTARTGVMLSNLDVAHKVLLVTSSLPGEGKTTVAINLALAHAQTKRTLLIDADMRRSQVGRGLGLPPGAKGLSNLVAGTAPAKDCVHAVEGSTLWVMPVGDLPPNPLELLLSQRFKDTLTALQEQFEMVIIDSPPVEVVSEALVLAPLATSTAFVVKAMDTPAPLVRKSLARLQRAGANLLGLMVNQLDFKHARLYYGEYGASSYAYGGYGTYGTYGANPKLTAGAAGDADAAQPAKG